MPDTGITTSSIIQGKNQKKRHAWHSTTPGSSYLGEASALEKALNHISINVPTIIFVDCKSMKDLLDEEITKYNQLYKNSARSYKVRIDKIKEKINQLTVAPPEIVHVPSHIITKLQDPTVPQSKKSAIKKQIQYLTNRLGSDMKDIIIEGNELADKLASDQAKSPIPKGIAPT
eukprot:TRINITY_DN1263_c0_g1_i7.p1 TRINITY_DN1263_c0_g1~~TRINITY_DN1263_c0_g1_i7.p1  ORF type:complete len:174 (+),score=16.75 TRINITY_DN1263_c0_g1_i7:518-1039(+)